MAISVNIKMYKVGELGDCFLLRFKNGGEMSHVLIDCGSFRNSGKSIKRMNVIANDIKDKLSDAKLDIVVGTHQHNDHLSGFVHAQKTFEAMKPEQVWLSWLDDPNNSRATAIGTDYNNYLTQLRLINKRVHSLTNGAKKNKLAKLMSFYGVDKSETNAKTDKLPPDLPKQAVSILRKLGKSKIKYLNPGEIFSLPGISEDVVKVYVLGPPISEDLLYDKNPSKSETFDPDLAFHNTQANKILSALNNLSKGNKNRDDELYPFDEPYFDSKNFDAVWSSYYNTSKAWRKIDYDWLNQAERLALWLDGFTNNSSLVLAFEMVKSKKVLLFVGDAQTGNWNSWKTIKWKKTPANFSWLTLMSNTVFYKTGHHGSHNSTLVEALKNMKHEELVAMIPVDKSDPNIKKKNGWKMPAKNLLKELKQSTQNRIMRMDDGISKSTAWKKLPFKPKVTKLYIEYEVIE
jgi:hypothetical protein